MEGHVGNKPKEDLLALSTDIIHNRYKNTVIHIVGGLFVAGLFICNGLFS